MRKRSSKRRTDAQVKQVLELIRAGHSIPDACKRVGIQPTVIYKRMQRSKAFAAEVESAELDAIDDAVRNIRNALKDGDVRVSQWVLERLRPERWGNRSQGSDKPTDIEVKFRVAGE